MLGMNLVHSGSTSVNSVFWGLAANLKTFQTNFNIDVKTIDQSWSNRPELKQ